jgi:hypothetical protein
MGFDVWSFALGIGVVIDNRLLDWLIVGVTCLVLRWFWRDCFRWPLTIGIDRGGYFFSVLEVRPGKLVMWPLASATWRVDNAGENMAACANVTSSAGDADPMAPLA